MADAARYTRIAARRSSTSTWAARPKRLQCRPPGRRLCRNEQLVGRSRRPLCSGRCLQVTLKSAPAGIRRHRNAMRVHRSPPFFRRHQRPLSIHGRTRACAFCRAMSIRHHRRREIESRNYRQPTATFDSPEEKPVSVAPHGRADALIDRAAPRRTAVDLSRDSPALSEDRLFIFGAADHRRSRDAAGTALL